MPDAMDFYEERQKESSSKEIELERMETWGRVDRLWPWGEGERKARGQMTYAGVGATPLTPLKPLEIVGSVHDPSMSLYRKEYLGNPLFSSEFSANNC